jgi:hypothetical protein
MYQKFCILLSLILILSIPSCKYKDPGNYIYQKKSYDILGGGQIEDKVNRTNSSLRNIFNEKELKKDLVSIFHKCYPDLKIREKDIVSFSIAAGPFQFVSEKDKSLNVNIAMLRIGISISADYKNKLDNMDDVFSYLKVYIENEIKKEGFTLKEYKTALNIMP